MTSSEPMTQRELLELAALDALGLLDEFEAAYYTRSFHDAPATVQDEIKRLQAELATDQRLLPGDEPDPTRGGVQQHRVAFARLEAGRRPVRVLERLDDHVDRARQIFGLLKLTQLAAPYQVDHVDWGTLPERLVTRVA